MRIFLLFCCVCCAAGLNAQNLVPNPSFEDTIQVNGQPGLDTWQTNIGTPDYFSEYFLAPLERLQTPVNSRGNQSAFNGVAYFGFAVLNYSQLNEREYLQIELIDSLRKGLVYEVEFYLSLADSFHYALADTDIGIVFKKQLESNNFDHEVREFRPYYTSDSAWDGSNKIDWQKFHYTHKALGGEKVLVIGCFLKDVDITVTNLGSGGISFFVKNSSTYYIDQISVQWKDTSTALEELRLEKALSLYPNPVKQSVFLHYTGQQNLHFQLFNSSGKEVSFSVVSQKDFFQFNLANLPRGVYFLRVNSNKQQHTLKLLKE